MSALPPLPKNLPPPNRRKKIKNPKQQSAAAKVHDTEASTSGSISGSGNRALPSTGGRSEKTDPEHSLRHSVPSLSSLASSSTGTLAAEGHTESLALPNKAHVTIASTSSLPTSAPPALPSIPSQNFSSATYIEQEGARLLSESSLSSNAPENSSSRLRKRSSDHSPPILHSPRLSHADNLVIDRIPSFDITSSPNLPSHSITAPLPTLASTSASGDGGIPFEDVIDVTQFEEEEKDREPAPKEDSASTGEYSPEEAGSTADDEGGDESASDNEEASSSEGSGDERSSTGKMDSEQKEELEGEGEDDSDEEHTRTVERSSSKVKGKEPLMQRTRNSGKRPLPNSIASSGWSTKKSKNGPEVKASSSLGEISNLPRMAYPDASNRPESQGGGSSDKDDYAPLPASAKLARPASHRPRERSADGSSPASSSNTRSIPPSAAPASTSTATVPARKNVAPASGSARYQAPRMKSITSKPTAAASSRAAPPASSRAPSTSLKPLKNLTRSQKNKRSWRRRAERIAREKQGLDSDDVVDIKFWRDGEVDLSNVRTMKQHAMLKRKHAYMEAGKNPDTGTECEPYDTGNSYATDSD